MEREKKMTKAKVNDESLDLTQIITMSEAMFTAWNADALAGAGEAAAYGQEPEMRVAWHAQKPLEAMLDGVSKALDGSTYNGNKRRGANDYLELMLNQARRMNDAGELLDAEMTDQAGAARFTKKGEQLNDRIQDMKTFIDMLTGIRDVIETAYTIAANGEEYRTPAQRQAVYQQNEAAQAASDQQLKAIFGIS